MINFNSSITNNHLINNINFKLPTQLSFNEYMLPISISVHASLGSLHRSVSNLKFLLSVNHLLLNKCDADQKPLIQNTIDRIENTIKTVENLIPIKEEQLRREKIAEQKLILKTEIEKYEFKRDIKNKSILKEEIKFHDKKRSSIDN